MLAIYYIYSFRNNSETFSLKQVIVSESKRNNFSFIVWSVSVSLALSKNLENSKTANKQAVRVSFTLTAFAVFTWKGAFEFLSYRILATKFDLSQYISFP